MTHDKKIKPPKTIKTVFSTSVELYLARRFRLIAKRKGTTVSQLLAQLIKDYEEAQANASGLVSDLRSGQESLAHKESSAPQEATAETEGDAEPSL